MPSDLFHFDFIVGQGGAADWVPVHQSFASLNEAILEQLKESVPHGRGAHWIHCETRPVPVTTGAKFSQLTQDDCFVLVFPLLGYGDEFVAVHVDASNAVSEQSSLDDGLRGDARMVGARHPQDLLAQQSVVSNENVLQRIVERVAQMQGGSDVGWRDNDAVAGGIRVARGHGVAKATGGPSVADGRLELLGRVGSGKGDFAVRRRHHAIISIDLRFPALVVLIGGLGMVGACDGQHDEQPQSVVIPDDRGLERAERLLAAGRHEEAAEMAVLLEASMDDDWRLHDLRARLRLRHAVLLGQQGLTEQSRFEAAGALAEYRRAIAISPTLSGLHQNAGDTAQMAGDSVYAQACYRRCIELDPDNVRAILCLSQLLEHDDSLQAKQFLDRVIAIDDQVPEAFAAMAVLEARAGHRDAAIRAIDRAVTLGADMTVVRLAQARSHRLLGEPHVGVEVLSSLPTDVQGQEGVAWELATCWETLGRFDRVADVWARMVAVNPQRWDRWRWALNAAIAAKQAGDSNRMVVMVEVARRAGAGEQEIREAIRGE